MARIRSLSGRNRVASRLFPLAILCLSVIPFATRAAVTEERESPRVATTIGPVGIVLIAANQQLYAFLDRLSDNAPVAGGTVRVKAPKTDLTLTETAPGVYRAGPFLPAVGHTPLTVSIESMLGSGQSAAELVVAPPPAPPTVEGRLRPLWYAVGATALAGLAGLAWRDRRRRRTPPLAGAGTV